MAHDELTIDIKTQNHGDALVYTLRGSFDVMTSPSVRAALVESASAGNHEIVVDLTQLEFMDSTGLGALIGAHRRATENGGVVRLVVNEGTIARLLNITGLVRIFAIYHSLEDALKDHARVIATV